MPTRRTLVGRRADAWRQARFGVENQARARLREERGEPRAAAPRAYPGDILVGCVSAYVAVKRPLLDDKTNEEKNFLKEDMSD